MTSYWLAMCVGALIVGVSKTAIGGLGTVAVAILATVLPTRESTAAALLLLLLGDAFAVTYYRQQVDWDLMRALLPSVLPGVLLGTLLLATIDDGTLRAVIGLIVLALLVIQLVIRGRELPSWVAGRAVGHAAGTAAGFVTMTANAAGAVITVFLVSRQVEKFRFVATGAWFFLIVNLLKVPFSASLGLFTVQMFWHAAVLAPVVAAGAWLGIVLLGRMSQSHFEVAVLIASGASAAALLLS